MAKPNKVVGVEEGERAYASSAEMEEVKRSIEALKKRNEQVGGIDDKFHEKSNQSGTI